MSLDQDAIRSLSPEQAIERLRAGHLEGQYWQQVLTDLHDLHDNVHAIASELERSTLAVLGLLPMVHSVGVKPLETIVDANKASMLKLRAMQKVVNGSLELIDGRSKVLDEVLQAIADGLGLELADDGDEAES